MELSNARARQDSVNIFLYRNRLAALQVIERKIRDAETDELLAKG